jgi:bifunctional non-homologous end joining protein LigD
MLRAAVVFGKRIKAQTSELSRSNCQHLRPCSSRDVPPCNVPYLAVRWRFRWQFRASNRYLLLRPPVLSYLERAVFPQRTPPVGFIAPCLPTKAVEPPSGTMWLHEIKHDGFRVIARKDSNRVRLYSRPGNDLTWRFPLIVEAVARLRSRSCIIDGEAVACDKDGMPSFDRLRYRRDDANVFMYVFDLIELNGDDLRREPLEVRKATLASVLAKASPGLRLNEHIIEPDGAIVFAHACKLGLEGIVSKRKDSTYRSGRSPDWLKSKNPECEAVRREAE